MQTIGEQLTERLEIGMKRYGHGVIVDSDTREWGTPKNSWIDMAIEEFLDGVIYVVADYIRKGRVSKEGMSTLEREYGAREADDNGLIMYITKNFNDMESPRHKMLLWNLFNMLLSCSRF
jgi:hypothetical protein|tara:strand:+ start:63 stop:422 length:360 start_codon:yes stop_codon:yes gene_type:complete